VAGQKALLVFGGCGRAQAIRLRAEDPFADARVDAVAVGVDDHCVRAVAQTSIRIAATATSAGRETTPNMSAIAAAEDRQASASLRSVVPR